MFFVERHLLFAGGNVTIYQIRFLLNMPNPLYMTHMLRDINPLKRSKNMRGNIMKRLLCVILVIAMVTAYAAPVYAADNVTVTFKQVDNDKVSATLTDREPVELREEEAPYADTDVVRVSIVLEKAGTIEAGFSTMNIVENAAAMNYRSELAKDQASVEKQIEKVIHADLDVVWNLTLAANIISANVEYGQIAAIEQIAGVKSVLIETRYEPDVVSTGAADPNMATSSAQIGSSAVWAAGYTGAGTTIAVIDTGADIEHEAFNSAAFDYSIEQLDAPVDLMDADDIAAVLSELNAYKRTGFSADELYFNSKVPFGFNYVDEDLDIVHVNDGQGEHGSHVAGISTANAYVQNEDGSFSYALDTTFVQGVAPDAQLLVMKVFGKGGGAYDSDYMAAIEDAVILGADSVNLSLGSGNPGMTRADGSSSELGAYQDILDNLEKSGVVVAISAGNSGYWAESAESGLPYLYLDDVSFQTNGSPGSYTNAFTVASVDNDGFTATYFNVGGNIVSFNDNTGFGNEPMTTLGGTQEFVFVNAIGELADFEAVGTDVLTGKIVMCYRGTTSFFEKANAAASMGAAGVVVVNNQAGIINMDLTGYEYTVPVVSILQADGEVFKAVGTENTTESGITYWTGSMEVSDSLGTGQYNSEYYTMSSFSSWGVPGSLELKPEITAPGGSIYSVAGAINGGTFGDHASYEVMSGTSMAAPQVTGMAALMAQYVRENNLDAKTGLDERTLTQSLLMSTAVPLQDAASGGNYYPVIQQGAGLANVGAATLADSYILMGADATVAYNDGKVKAELGDDPEKTGVYSFSFTLNNLTNVEKHYDLYADVFTQDAFSYSGILLMDTCTTGLNPAVTWTVNGMEVKPDEALAEMDFNGDGVVDTADGQLVLDLATGLDVTLTNADKADLNGDGEITSRDAYLFFRKLYAGDATVAPNGSVAVSVTITLSDADREWLANYENGAYIQGYVYAESLTSAEGVAGTVHSVPLLAYYGNWSDPSMFDKGSYLEYAHGLENRPPYLYSSVYGQGMYNGMLISYADMEGEYWFGGNPMVTDETYMPERNAFSMTRGDTLTKLGFTAIRNAADSWFQIVDNETGEVYFSVPTGAVDSAYYYANAGTWSNTYYTLNLGLQPDLQEDTSVAAQLTLVPEYYVDAEGNVDVEALGDGVTFSIPMIIDNTAPTVDDVDIDTENNVLTVTATDNQYIAAVALYDIYGQYMYTYTGSDAEQAAADTVAFALDLTEVNGPSFLLQVYDYAMNTATYEITTQIGEVTDTIESIELSETSVVMQLNSTKALTGIAYPVNASDRGVIWTSSDASVVSVDENGTLTANAVGTATITATATADETITATCAVEVIDISAQLNGIVWDEEGSIWFSEFAANDLPNYEKLSPDMLDQDYFVAAAVADDGTLYASTLNTSSSTGSLYTIDPVTYEATLLSDCMVQGLHIFYSDLTYVPAMFGTGALLGTYGPYVIAIDPATGEALGIIDQYDSELVGIAACYGATEMDDELGVVYQDVVYVIQNDGTVIQELYYGYGGQVVPYYYYAYGERAAMDSGVNVGSAWYFNSAYYDGSYLYWSAFDVDTENAVTLYAIDADYSGNVYTMGQFGEGVWPVGGLYQMNAAANEAGAEFVDVNIEIDPSDIQLVVKEIPVEEVKAGGSLNAVSGSVEAPVRPLSSAATGCEENVFTVDVTAKVQEEGAVDSHNGLVTVSYDAEALTLVDISGPADFYSVNDQVEGQLTIGYVSLEPITANAAVATLTFEVKDEKESSVSVFHAEHEQYMPDYTEILDVNLSTDHDYQFISMGFNADYTEAYAYFQCSKCGDEVTYDAELSSEVVKAATCTESGMILYTATYGEYSEGRYEELAPTGHNYVDDTCTNCGEKILASGWSGYTTRILNDKGVLTISPSGQTLENGQCNMRNYWKVNGVLTLPWGEYADQITSVVVEDGVNAIGQMAFYGLENLETVTLAGSVSEIRNYAFKNCSALTDINLWTVSYIREGAFYGCSALKDVVLGDDVVIEDWAFSRTGVILN